MEAKSKRLLKRFAALILFALSLSKPAHAIAPQWKFAVLRSPHFELIYRVEQMPLAKTYIIAAERAYSLLMPIFNEGPEKTIIMLADETDSSNGGAEFLPYPQIIVYPVLPLPGDSIDNYGDWALEMMVHEYTHILNMYPRHGFYVPLSWIFGNVMRPNAALPRWYLEGLAVDTESRLTDHGRLRADETLASARALLLEDRLKYLTIHHANQQNIASWPYGNRPYLYGGWWWESVNGEKGTAVIQTWNQNFSRRLPFLLNGPMIEATGKDASEWLQFTKVRLTVRAQKDIDTIQATDPPNEQEVSEADGEQTVFAVSPSGNRLIYWIKWVNSDAHSHGSEVHIKERSADSLKPAKPTDAPAFSSLPDRVLFNTIGTTQVRWLDDDRVVFDQLDYRAPYVSYRDLFLYDFRTNHTERLTKGARAQQPSPSPNGEDIVFVQNDGGQNHLALLHVATKEIHPLVDGNLTQRLSGPEFFTRDQIVFSVRGRSGTEMLNVYDLSSKKAKLWTNQLREAQSLRRISTGFLVTDASHGIRNVYWIHDGQVEAVSNTLTSIESADFDPIRRELIVSELTADGNRLKSLTFAIHRPPAIGPADIPPPPPLPKAVESAEIKEESFQPLSYMLPRYWIPFVYQTEQGLVFQGITDSKDPTGRNHYSLMGSYDTVTKKPSYGISYENGSTPVGIGASYEKSESYLGASDLILDSQSAALQFTPNWPFNDRYYRWSLGGLWLETTLPASDVSAVAFRRIGPTIAWQYSGMKNPNNRWHSFHIELSHQEFVKQPGYYNYGRSMISAVNLVQLGGGHKVFLQTRASMAPREPMSKVLFLGDPNIGGNYAVNLTNSNFLLRGYASGEFVGRKVLNANLEYGLPLFPLERGYGTFPLYLQSMEWLFFVDTMAVDGRAEDTKRQSYVSRNLGQFASGAGSELRFDATAAYQLPINLTLGLYYGMEERFGGGLSPLVTISYGALDGLQDKTP